MSKSFVEQAREAFDKNKDLSGLQAIIQGVEFYMAQITAIANEAEEADAGLVIHVMTAVSEALRSGIPGAKETEQLIASLLSTTVITIPKTFNNEREDEEI